MSESTWSALLARQAELEAVAGSEGAARFRAHLQRRKDAGTASSAGATAHLVSEALGSLEAAFREALRTPRAHTRDSLARITQGLPTSKKDTGRPLSQHFIEMCGPATTAFLCLKVMLDATASGEAAAAITIATRISTLMADELRYRRLRALDPDLFKRSMSKVHGAPYTRAATVLDSAITAAPIDCSDLDLGDYQSVRIGFQLLDICAETLGFWTVEMDEIDSRHERARMVVTLNTEIASRLAKSDELRALQEAVEKPMIVPPLDWEPYRRGGYRFGLRHRYPLVTRGASEAFINAATMPEYFAAINTLQATSWKVNTRVLDVVQEMVSLGAEYLGIPPGENAQIPRKPADYDTLTEDAQRAWRTEAFEVRRNNRARTSATDALTRSLDLAESFRNERAFWFVYFADYRSRLYARCAGLNPQGSDLEKALLTFADAKPVDAEGRQWLAVHLANCLGVLPDGRKVSHLTFADRYAWVTNNTSIILATADDPIGCPGLLLKADAPLMLMAACIEWANLTRASDRGETYASSLPVRLDGSCSGLQHWSAALADEIGGAATNVSPAAVPQDIYRRVADTLLARIRQDARSTDQPSVASLWLDLHERTGIINRALAKRPTMTVTYGSKAFRFGENLMEDLEAREDSRDILAHFAVLDEAGREWRGLSLASTYMAKQLWETLATVVTKAFEGMAWAVGAARGIVKEGKPIEFAAPTGFPIRQPHRLEAQALVGTVLMGTFRQIVTWCEKPEIDKPRQIAALAANVVHSWDASHLVYAINACVTEGITHFAAVHDSLGVHCGDISTMRRALRETFARMHSQDLIGELHRQLAAQHRDPSKCSLPPIKGTLKLDGVLTSDYFFS